METIDSTMEQEDISELPGGPTEVSDPAPMVLDKEEQLIVDEPAHCAAAAESFPAFSFMASPPLVDSTGRPKPVHHTRPSQWGASSVPLAQATRLPLHSQWGHHKPPCKQKVPRKETPKPSAASVKKAPPVAALQPPPKDETPAPLERGNGEYLLPVFHVAPFGTAVAMQETHHLDLFSFTDSFLEQSLDPYGISMGSTMFLSTALLQPIDEPIPSYQTITTRSCASSGSAPTCASANEELKWPEASWAEGPVCTGKYVKVTMSPSSSTSYTKPVGITALMSSMPPQPCKRSKNTILRLTMNKPTYGMTSGRMISVTPSRTSWMLLEPEDGNTSVDCFTSTTRNIPCSHLGTRLQGVFPIKNPGVDRNEVNAILHYFCEETRDTLRFRASCKEPEKVVHFYHLLQVNVPDCWPRTEATEPYRLGTNSADGAACRAADGTLLNDAAEPADSKLPATAMPDSSHGE